MIVASIHPILDDGGIHCACADDNYLCLVHAQSWTNACAVNSSNLRYQMKDIYGIITYMVKESN